MAGFLDYFKNNLVNDTTRVGMPIKRAEYVMAVWRLGLILERCHNEGLAGDLARIEECGIEILEKDPILAIMAGLARLSREELVRMNISLKKMPTASPKKHISIEGNCDVKI